MNFAINLDAQSSKNHPCPHPSQIVLGQRETGWSVSSFYISPDKPYFEIQAFPAQSSANGAFIDLELDEDTKETLDILSDLEVMSDLDQAQKEIAKGRLIDEETHRKVP